MLQATSYIDPVNTPYARCLGEHVYVYREFITVHNFHQFEKVELNKFSRAAKIWKICAGSAKEITEQFRSGKLNSLRPN